MSSSFLSNWTTQVRKGVLELCILRVLVAGRLYGYDIVKRLRGVKGLVIREGTVYPILSRLKKEGFLHTQIEESTEGPPRKYYELTPAGARELALMRGSWEELVASIATLPGGELS
jgi:PadR family transcriptional regulator PadR